MRSVTVNDILNFENRCSGNGKDAEKFTVPKIEGKKKSSYNKMSECGIINIPN